MILSYIFYGFGFFIFLHSLMNLIRFEKYYFIEEWFHKYKKVTGIKPMKSDFRDKEDYNLYKNKSLFLNIEFLWICTGIFTNNWFVFLFLLIIGFVFGLGLKKIRFTITYKVISFIYVSMKTLLYLFLFINKFHLNIDILNFITSFV